MRTALLVLRIAVAGALALAAVALPVGASTDISIDFDEVRFGRPGSVLEVAEVDVDPDLVGETCTLEVHAENQVSVHLGNDLIVSTGSAQAVIIGVEDTANGGTDQTYDMALGDKITIDLRFGQDGMSSLGFGLTFDCGQPSPGAPNVGRQVVETTTTAPTAPAVAPTSASSSTSAPSTASAPAVTATTSGPATTSNSSSTTPASTATGVPATVGGSAIGRGLPETPAARAVAAAPAYTG